MSVQSNAMNEIKIPLIKGIFINSHIRHLRNDKGDAAIIELERRYGKPLEFKTFENVPVIEEVRILDLILEITGEVPIDEHERDFESGRHHFRNFATTPFGKILMGAVPKTPEGFRIMLTSSGYISRHVFKNLQFDSEPSDENTLVSIMFNSGYPLHHFRGLYYEWMRAWDLHDAQVEAYELGAGHHKYCMIWNRP